MKKLIRPFALAMLLGIISIPAMAQRARTVGGADNTAPSTTATTTTQPAPQTVKAKYEGGVFGHKEKQEGTLTFDDVNQRLLFSDNKQREVLFIPYDAITSAFADTQSRRPKAATIASNIPTIFALPARFIKTKVRYLTLQYSDQDTQVSGVTSFRLSNKETLISVLNTLAQKASLAPRGEVFVKTKTQGSTDQTDP